MSLEKPGLKIDVLSDLSLFCLHNAADRLDEKTGCDKSDEIDSGLVQPHFLQQLHVSF